MKRKVILSSLLRFALLLALAPAALANTTWYVNGVNGSDSNNCMSRTTACKTIGHAIGLARSGDTVRVAAATYTENLTIRISLKVLGAGAGTTILDGGRKGTVVTIPNASTSVILSGVTIRNGLAQSGGGIYSLGTLTIYNTTVSGNVATPPRTYCHPPTCYSGSGGGIYNVGTLTINKSTVSGNLADDLCFLVFNPPPPHFICLGGAGGGISSPGALTISNSTISGNAAVCSTRFECLAPSAGGGIYGTLTISNSTISGNSADMGGGINGQATLQNSIVAHSVGGNCSGTMTSNGYNLSSDNTCDFDNSGDRNNIDPKLGPLQNNRGPTDTMALLPGSPAIDAGNPSGCTDSQGHLVKTDQRGFPRPDREDTSGCDMGAYESQSD